MTLADRVAAALSAPPLSQVSPAARAELLELTASASRLEDLPGRWQAAVLAAESGGAAAASACGCGATGKR
ncbi:MAG: hypothetical protein QOJ07_352 [Thermoleophilaceae bacterium]|nr:hypothetical protein [Thermoleophilaceae bacterium]